MKFLALGGRAADLFADRKFVDVGFVRLGGPNLVADATDLMLLLNLRGALCGFDWRWLLLLKLFIL